MKGGEDGGTISLLPQFNGCIRGARIGDLVFQLAAAAEASQDPGMPMKMTWYNMNFFMFCKYFEAFHTFVVNRQQCLFYLKGKNKLLNKVSLKIYWFVCQIKIESLLCRN